MAHQMAGERDELAGADEIDGVAPPVRFEPCAEFRIDHASSWPVCDACGWLDEDHAPVAPMIAVVRDLPRWREAVPERKAS
jgi:hypothetical protein